MSSNNLDVFMPVFIMMLLAAGIFAVSLIASNILSPKGKSSRSKNEPYECGEDAVGSAWSAFNARFYVVGLIFIIFDVESVLMFPIAAVFKSFTERGHGLYVLDVFLSFIFVLAVGIAYCWKKGDLDWVKSFRVKDNE